jgi:hypothetical protein
MAESTLSGSSIVGEWQKALYLRQPFADNHVAETFLASLVTNGGVYAKKYSNHFPISYDIIDITFQQIAKTTNIGLWLQAPQQ